MSDFVDEMIYEPKPDVKRNHSNYLKPIEKAMDQVTRKAQSGKLTEGFHSEQTAVSVKKRPRYLAQALRKTKQTLRRYNQILRRLG